MCIFNGSSNSKLKNVPKVLPSWYFYWKIALILKYSFLCKWLILFTASSTTSEALILKLELETNSWPGINISAHYWYMTQHHRLELLWEKGEKYTGFVFLLRGYSTAFTLMFAGDMSPGAPSCCSAPFYCGLWFVLCARSAFEQLCQGQLLPSENALEEEPLCFLAWFLNFFYNQLH